jgi:hypothetical protein
MEHLAPPDPVQEVVAAVLASGRKPTVKEVCRVLVIEMGLRNCAETRALALATVAALGLPAPKDKTLEGGLKPGRHTAGHVEAQRAANRAAMAKIRSTPEGRERTLIADRTNRLSKLLASCRKSSAKRAHGFVDETHLCDLWVRAQAGETPWHSLLDFAAYGVAEDTGKAGSPWAPSFDRLANGFGYVAGNVAVVPNVLNRTCNRYDRRLVLGLVAQAARLRSERRQDEADLGGLRAARPRGYHLEGYLSGSSANVFRHHPALVPHQAEMMERSFDALYGPGGGICPVTGLAFSAEPGHPCFPSWDLIDHRLCCQRRFVGTGRDARLVSTEGGRERPSDMRLVVALFNYGRNVWKDADWWRMADRVRELVDAGVQT